MADVSFGALGPTEATLTVRWCPGLPGMDEPTEVWIAPLTLEGYPESDELLEVLLSGLERPAGGHEPYVLDESRVRFSWGASNSTLAIVLDISDRVRDYAVGAAIAGTFKAAHDTVLRRWHERREIFTDQPISAEEAIGRAGWMLATSYGVNEPNPTVVAEEVRVDGRRVVRLRADDRDFEIELSEEDGLVIVLRHGWSEPRDI